ncbi:AIPR protein [Burkholderia sp. OK233]|nr:AIPR protein [Burkholderia sp. OK233]
MSNLLDWNTLENKVKSYLDDASGINTAQKAFPTLMVASILGISDEEASDAITDGSKDRGVDAIFIDERSGNCVHLFQFKYVDKFSNSAKNFPSGEIEKLESYVSAMLNSDIGLKKTCNPILWSKTQEIWEALQKPDIEFKIHFCGNLAEMVDEEKERANEAFKKYRKFSVQHHSLESIVGQFLDAKRPKIDRTITVVDKDYFDRTDGNVRGLICSVEALEIVKMVDDPDNPKEIYGPIFNDNVRVYLSKKNKINKKIIESALSDNSGLFWYLNNGITITCDSFSYLKGRRAPQVDLHNIQIVNGGQTTHALYEVYKEKPDALDDVLVLVRIIETKSDEFGLAIAESTNSQTPIKGRDLRSNDEIQKKLEVGFSAIGYFYERKLNQSQGEPRSQRIDAIECAQAHVAYTLGLPEVAKKDRGRIFGDLYDTVFTDELSTQALLCAHLLMVEIDKLKKQVQKSVREGEANAGTRLFLIDGAFHVLYALHVICARKGVDQYDFPAASKHIPAACLLMKKIVDRSMKKDDAFSFNRFFKDARTKELIAAEA